MRKFYREAWRKLNKELKKQNKYVSFSNYMINHLWIPEPVRGKR